MKQQTKFILFASLMMAFILAGTMLFGMDIFSCTTFAATLAATVPVIPVTGETPTTVTAEKSEELLQEDISQSVTQMMPARTPIDTIIRSLKRSQKAESQKLGYYQVAYKPIRDNLDPSASGTGANASSPAKSFTYDDTEMTKIFVAVVSPDIWRVHDTLLMRDLTLPGTKGAAVIGGSGTHKDDVMFYVASKSGNTLELVPVGGVRGASGAANADKYVVPDFSADTVLIRMGQAKSELSITTDPFAMYPSLSWQYCQNFMAQIEESTFHRITKKEVNWGFSNFEAVNILSMKMEMELSMLFGMGGEIVTGNDRTYFTRGITRDIDRVLNYGTGSGDRTVSKEDYNTWLKEVFDGNNGSTNRILFAGSGLLKSIAQVDEFQKQLSSTEKKAELGIDVRTIHTNFGTLDIVHAPLFRESGWEDNGLILDLEHITKYEFVPMSVTNLDLKKSGQKNADARVIQEVSALTLRYPDCHAIIKPKA